MGVDASRLGHGGRPSTGVNFACSAGLSQLTGVLLASTILSGHQVRCPLIPHVLPTFPSLSCCSLVHHHLAACNLFWGPVACATWKESRGRGHISVISLDTRRADNRQQGRSTRIFSRSECYFHTPRDADRAEDPRGDWAARPIFRTARTDHQRTAGHGLFFWPDDAAGYCASNS